MVRFDENGSIMTMTSMHISASANVNYHRKTSIVSPANSSTMSGFYRTHVVVRSSTGIAGD